ncbi:hypothetical protein ACSNOK_07145 [Streptomyces sp. URMC 126]|uniref:hypothetical protein n=1 Tax=Streptomyces sp. URMC 126 TaxID=3423401 RepID=UPI003F19BFE5
MSAVPRSRPARLALWSAGGLLAVGAIGGSYVAGLRLWNGTPYPPADPDRIAVRLKAQAQRVYDEAALPRTPEAPSRVGTSACDYRGLRSIAHIDQGRRDVRRFELSWRVTDVPEATARSAEERTRRRLERQGWKLTLQDVSDHGFWFEQPVSGDTIDVDWYRSTGTYAVTAYAPCGKVPDGFDEYAWAGAGWSPE